jgi:hypothetical protein
MTRWLEHKKLQSLALAVCLAVPAVTAASAQGGLFDKAKDVLGTFGESSPGTTRLTTGEIASGLREALRVGTERVVAQVGTLDGFNGDPAIHIPLPGALRSVQSALSRFGMAGLADDLETRLNRAAESAAPEAKELFWQAIIDMTLEDVQRLYDGPDDAATEYFKSKMSRPLAERMVPIVEHSLLDVGAIRSYDQMMGQYRALPFVPDVKADLTAYVVEKALDGIFHYVAKEEAAIRTNPAARTTDLLKRVFAGG